jgi:putative ABC transport system permease protein
VADVEDMPANEQAVKAALSEQGFMAMTVEDQLGVITGIIDTVTWVLNGFALIALLAASFGIVNTLLMSVQERTREIGLMKALGMSGGKVFGLFSMEAVMLGIMGSVIGVGLGIVVGLVGNAALVNGPLSGVAGLSLFAVAPMSIVLIVLLILAIAFLAGTMPAARAAKKDPIEALRYE